MPSALGLLNSLAVLMPLSLCGGTAAWGACGCEGKPSPCGEIVAGAAAFTGRVVSVSPAFLNRYSRANNAETGRVLPFYEELSLDEPARDLPQLKEAFRALVPGLSPITQERVTQAKSRAELLRLFEGVLYRGSYVTFDVKIVYAVGGDDDDDRVRSAKPSGKNSDDDDDNDSPLAAGKLYTVWTPYGGCGIDFQTGETYLVYTSMDEDSDVVETDSCMGTRRLSDAGADLPYLTFYKLNPKSAGRLEGFVTTDRVASANPPREDSIPSPAGGILVELQSNDGARYTTSAADGRFTFDGLSENDYQISGYATPYPDTEHVVAGPDNVKIKLKACGKHVLLARPPG
jgi:hypothetical protein